MDKVLEVDGITKEFPGRTAVTNLSFTVIRGAIHGFLGPNGAGKSTTMKMVAGLINPSSGSIKLFGEQVSSENSSIRNQLGFLPENAPLFLDMSVEDYVHYVARLHSLVGLKSRVEQVMDELGLIEVRRRLIGNLSKGYKQRVGLAQAIVYDAPFLMLDEPTSGLDPQSVVELREFIKKLSSNKTILFSSHVLSEVEHLCDHITIIHKGRIRASGPIQDIRHKFRQGFSVKVGIGAGEKLPQLVNFGHYEIAHHYSLSSEEQFIINFESDADCRFELAKYLLSQGHSLRTLRAESPELEDIFLHMTENRQ